jgi:hypothetical protein
LRAADLYQYGLRREEQQRHILYIFVRAFDTSVGIGPGDTTDDDPTLCDKEAYANLCRTEAFRKYLSIVLAPSLVAGSLFWSLEWAYSAAILWDA